MEAETIQPRTKAGLFFIIAFGWSLAFWGLTVVLGGIDNFPGSILQYVGGAGPLVSALIITHLFEKPPIQKDFWNRTFNPKRIPWRWGIIALITHPAIILVSIGVDLILGGEAQIQSTNLTDIGAIISLVFFVFVFGPLPEEMGWRGVGYDRLQRHVNALTASLILGVAWAAWHIPLFLIDGTFQNQLGFGSYRFWIFLASNIPLTVIMTWVYNHTNRSILSAVLVHFSGNIIGAIITKSNRLALLELIGLSLIASIIVIMFGHSLSHIKKDEV